MSTASQSPRANRFFGLYRMLALDVVLPLVAVQTGLHAGLTPVVALAIQARSSRSPIRCSASSSRAA